MSFHLHPKYQRADLIEALKLHGLPHDRPSQLADSFRAGFLYYERMIEEKQKSGVDGSDQPPL